MIYTLIDHRNDVIKCSELCSETTRLRLVFPLEFGTFYDVISMVYKSVDHGKLWSICSSLARENSTFFMWPFYLTHENDETLPMVSYPLLILL